MKPNRIAVFLGHPAHYHMFKNMTAALEKEGVEVDYLVKRKDVLEQLVRESGHPYYMVRSKERTAKGKLGLMWSLLSMELKVTVYIVRRRPRLLIGTYAPVISHLTGVKMIVCCEDDTAVVPRFARTSYPYADAILAPVYCDGGRWDPKMTKYCGFQKLAYLHPNQFTPCWEVVAPKLRQPQRPYAIMRFSQLKAHHDNGVGGISNQLALSLIALLAPYYDVYITSERPLPKDFEPYQLDIDPMDLHHWLAFASFYIGDSQSMAVEAAMLGIPGVRFSGFAGRIGVLEELEHHYGLTCAVPATQPQQLLDKVKELIAQPDLRDTFQRRRRLMLAENIDVTAFFTKVVEDYLKRTI